MTDPKPTTVEVVVDEATQDKFMDYVRTQVRKADPVKTVTIRREDMRHLFDLAVDTPLVCSGSFDTEDVELLRRIAVLLGVDPNGITPDEFASQYPHPHQRRQVHAAMAYGETGEQAQARIARQRADPTCWVGTYGRRCGKPENDPIHAAAREATEMGA